MMRLAAIALLAALAVPPITTEDTRAYTFYMTKNSEFPLRWWQRPEMIFTLSTVPPEETDAGSIQALIESAFDTWITTSCGLVPEVVYAGTSDAARATTPTSLRTEPDNLIVFIRSASEWTSSGNSPTWIAITKIAHDPDSGEIVDADIEINDGGYVFSYDDSPTRNQVDFLSMITHELGHFYGLDHSTEASATMYATYATSPQDATEARSLAQDDSDGICTLYADVPVHRDRDPDDGGCCGSGPGGGWPLAAFGMILLGLRVRWRWG